MLGGLLILFGMAAIAAILICGITELTIQLGFGIIAGVLCVLFALCLYIVVIVCICQHFYPDEDTPKIRRRTSHCYSYRRRRRDHVIR